MEETPRRERGQMRQKKERDLETNPTEFISALATGHVVAALILLNGSLTSRTLLCIGCNP
jgi:hypothetical protein